MPLIGANRRLVGGPAWSCQYRPNPAPPSAPPRSAAARPVRDTPRRVRQSIRVETATPDTHGPHFWGWQPMWAAVRRFYLRTFACHGPQAPRGYPEASVLCKGLLNRPFTTFRVTSSAISESPISITFFKAHLVCGYPARINRSNQS